MFNNKKIEKLEEKIYELRVDLNEAQSRFDNQIKELKEQRLNDQIDKYGKFFVDGELGSYKIYDIQDCIERFEIERRYARDYYASPVYYPRYHWAVSGIEIKPIKLGDAIDLIDKKNKQFFHSITEAQEYIDRLKAVDTKPKKTKKKKNANK